MIYIYNLWCINNSLLTTFLYNPTILFLFFYRTAPTLSTKCTKKYEEQNNAYTKSTFSGKESTKIWKEMHRLNIP